MDNNDLVYEPDTARGLWKIAKIKELIFSNDNEIRSVKIEYADGFITRRAINHLYPIEEDIVDLESVTDHHRNNESLNLHIQKENKNYVSQNHSTDSFHSLRCSSPGRYTSLHLNKEMAVSSLSKISIEDISSSDDSLSVSEKETLQKELKETRKAESIIRKELKATKRSIEKMLEEYTKVVKEEMEKRTGLHPVIEISDKLIQLSTNITQALKTRNEFLVELADVKKENQNIRKAFNELSK
uniref:DUF5641 domain-containing protein n=1 Tax=Panagrolaimus sp. ES5 TaxID=591445 RepID=A0AC34FH16_9BILA